VRTIFSTAAVRRAERFDYWMDTVRAHLSRGFKSTALERDGFSAALKLGMLGDIALADCRSSPVTAWCTGADDLILVLPGTRSTFEFDHHRFEVNAHGLYLLDCRQPFALRSIEAPKRLQVFLPRDELAQRIALADIVNRPWPLTRPARALVAFVREIARIGPSTIRPVVQAVLREQLLELVALAFRGAAEGANDNALWLPVPGFPGSEFISDGENLGLIRARKVIIGEQERDLVGPLAEITARILGEIGRA